ncbi:MAG: acyl-CoA dehydrogenase [Gammaproteobacteria bacterium]|nr:acyl-CoA dehydrogenase [Gammaproteobacteria bacterium]|tara:strand:+ start:2063 stop:4501 length:2439 start_codon:yes stop_codon:yes gene_type:complete
MSLIGFIFWILVFFTALIVLCYKAVELRTATITLGIILLIFTIFGHPPNIILAIEWVMFAVLVSFNIPEIRRNYVSKQILKFYKAVLPSISKTEKEAIDAGGIWWDGEIFTGKPDWEVLRKNPKPMLTKEEQAFLDGPVEEVCEMTDNWAVNHKDYDLPKEVWEFLKTKGFFSMIIPKKYGGLEFSPLAVATVMSKITTRSGVLNSTVGVPNSLGPAELLLHYGTPEQRKELLPKLASGEEIPCFALTGPRAGSDAAAMPDKGIVCKGKFEGKEIIGMKLNFSKRYITLSPVATLVGLAFKLYDPDHLIGEESDYGITCALIPSKTKGLQIGPRHLPLGIPFMNGTIIGTDIFVPLDYIIGGIEKAGKGWRMLVECLSAGRAISLPSGAMGGAKAAACSTGSYARIREQFNVPIAEFEGITEPLGRIAGYTYIITASVNTTAMAIGAGEKPAVISAIMKYHSTEMARKIILDAMDVHGGKAVMRGPKNYMASGYEAGPIGITVEGANILTRSLIIFGQGAFRCHPYVLKEIEAVEIEDENESLEQFDLHFFNHVAYTLSNIARSFVLGISNRFGNSPVIDETENYYKQINRFSAAFALLTDVSMLVLGGSLKRKETLSARLGDVLSSLYLASTTLKYYEDQGDKETDLPLVHWSCKTLIFEAQNKIHEILVNFPNRFVAASLRFFIFPLGRNISGPSIKNTLVIGDLISRKTKTREKLCQGIYLKNEPTNHLATMEHLLDLYETANPIKVDLMKARKKGLIEGNTLEELIDAAVNKDIISEEQANQLSEYDQLVMDVINVDDFSEKELKEIR